MSFIIHFYEPSLGNVNNEPLASFITLLEWVLWKFILKWQLM